MRTSLTEVRQIESYLQQSMEPTEKLAFEARMAADKGLGARVKKQQLVQAAVTFYGRKRLRKELQAVEHRLLHSPEKRWFQIRVQSIFNQKL
jgi:hypothetical protein